LVKLNLLHFEVNITDKTNIDWNANLFRSLAEDKFIFSDYPEGEGCAAEGTVCRRGQNVQPVNHIGVGSVQKG